MPSFSYLPFCTNNTAFEDRYLLFALLIISAVLGRWHAVYHNVFIMHLKYHIDIYYSYI